jgi:chromosome segregation ATPase
VELLKDRNYYRMCDDTKLFDEAKHTPNAELAIVLAERLEAAGVDYEAQVAEVTDHAKDLEEDVDRYLLEISELEHKIDVLELMLNTRDETIDELKKGN